MDPPTEPSYEENDPQPDEWLNVEYEPWINKSNMGEGMSERQSQSEQDPSKEVTGGEIIGKALQAGYIVPDDTTWFDSDRQSVLDGVAEHIQRHGDDPVEVFRDWGVEYHRETE